MRSTTLKTAAVAPIPSASVRIAVIAKTDFAESRAVHSEHRAARSQAMAAWPDRDRPGAPVRRLRGAAAPADALLPRSARIERLRRCACSRWLSSSASNSSPIRRAENIAQSLIHKRTQFSHSDLLVCSQSLHGIDGGGAACGNPRGNERYERHQERDKAERHGIERTDLKEEAVQQCG